MPMDRHFAAYVAAGLARGLASRPGGSVPACDVLVICHDVNRPLAVDGTPYSPLMDSVARALELRGLRVARVATPFSRLTGAFPAFAIASVNPAFARAMARAGLGAALPPDRRALGDLRLQRFSEPVWASVIEASGARAVVAVQPDSGLCSAGRAAGIPVIDVQHGVVSPASHYYSRLLAVEHAPYLPTGYWCWNDATATWLAGTPLGARARVEVTGHPWLARFAAIEPDDQIVDGLIAEVERAVPAAGGTLVTLQWGTAVEQYAPLTGAIRAVASELGAGCPPWLIRLHPVQLVGGHRDPVVLAFEELARELGSPSPRRLAQVALPALLARASAHVTLTSSTVLEAAWLGVPSCVVEPRQAPREAVRGSLGSDELPHVAFLADRDAIAAWLLERARGGSRPAAERAAHAFRLPALVG